jgi:uncharacterized membrane protein required for colicin V production
MSPLLSVIQRFNWVDTFFIILLLRIGYIAFKTGFVTEFFKLLGTLLAIYVAMHYYTALSDFLGGRFGLDKKLPLDFLDFICFILLAIISYLIGIFFRQALCRLIKLEAVPRLNKWGGFVIGIARVVLLAGLFAFIFSISTVKYLHDKVADSYFGVSLIKVAPATYSSVWYGFMSKFMPTEKFNKTILEVQTNFNQ